LWFFLKKDHSFFQVMQNSTIAPTEAARASQIGKRIYGTRGLEGLGRVAKNKGAIQTREMDFKQGVRSVSIFAKHVLIPRILLGKSHPPALYRNHIAVLLKFDLGVVYVRLPSDGEYPGRQG
jgi:hypothetical protein